MHPLSQLLILGCGNELHQSANPTTITNVAQAVDPLIGLTQCDLDS
jgi:hypothetical protein